MVNILALVNGLLLEAHGLDPSLALIEGSLGFSDNLIAISLSELVATWIYWILRGDWQATPLGDDLLEIRRLFRYLWLVIGVVVRLIGFQNFLRIANCLSPHTARYTG